MSSEGPDGQGNEQGRELGGEALTKHGKRSRQKRTVKPQRRRQYTGAEKIMILDCLRRSGLSVTDFAVVCGVGKETLYTWRRRFQEEGPAGLEPRPRGRRGSRLRPETQRAILMIKECHPEWGSERIHDVLKRSEGFTASPGAILRVLKEAGYEVESPPSRAHRDKKRRFERARPNQLWQSDLFTFTLKRANRRVILVAFLDDHSRFVTGHLLAASATNAVVKEALLSAIARFGAPEELLTDNGPPYATWRGTSAFTRLLRQRGIAHVRSRPRSPQTCGKIERFWQSLWQECLVDKPLAGLDEARELIARFIDHYNFARPHQGIEGLVPADRFFSAQSSVREALEERVRQRSEEGAVAPLYLAGRVGSESVSLHSEDGQLILVGADGSRREVSLGAAEPGPSAAPASGDPGASDPDPPAPPAGELTSPEPAQPPAAEPAQPPAAEPVSVRPEPALDLDPVWAELLPEMAADPPEPALELVSVDEPPEQTRPSAVDESAAIEGLPDEPGGSPLDGVMRELRGLFGDGEGR